MIQRIALFDIDGTILTTQGQAVRAMMTAMEDVYGIRPDNDGHLMDGKTELCIVHELLGAAGRTRPEIEALLPRFWTRYEDALAKCIHPGLTYVYPGVRELIERLRLREEIGLGLLTGNCPPAARIKLAAAGLLEAFQCGAFGDRHEERSDLPRLALDAARARGWRAEGRAVSVLGDTPNDIRCARPFGFKAIAVATGRYGVQTLEEHGPDYLFADFTDGAAVEAAILAE